MSLQNRTIQIIDTPQSHHTATGNSHKDSKTEVQVPHTHELLPAFQEFLREAIQLSCGDYDGIIDDYPVAFGNSWKSNGDFQCFVAAAIFSKTIGMQNKLQGSLQSKIKSEQEASCGGGGGAEKEGSEIKQVSTCTCIYNLFTRNTYYISYRYILYIIYLLLTIFMHG